MPAAREINVTPDVTQNVKGHRRPAIEEWTAGHGVIRSVTRGRPRRNGCQAPDARSLPKQVVGHDTAVSWLRRHLGQEKLHHGNVENRNGTTTDETAPAIRYPCFLKCNITPALHPLQTHSRVQISMVFHKLQAKTSAWL